MAEEPKYDNMVGKPLFDILSKLPSKSLLRFRCVSKLWREYIDDSYFVSVHDKQVIEDPTPIIFYSKANMAKTAFCFHTIESDTITNHVLKAKNKVPVFEFVVKKPLSGFYFTRFLGSCNGFVLIMNYQNYNTTFTVIHPVNKQCYQLPKLPLHYSQDFCGLGFDSSTNTFKMVCVYLNTNYPYLQCTMVHVFGTNSWYKIPKVPSYEIYGKAIFAHGCLHWLVSDDYDEDLTREVIWFDVKKEEFGLMKPPGINSMPSKMIFTYPINDHLVDLDGQVGYFVHKTAGLWVLNHKREWVLQCAFEDHEFLHDGVVKVLGCLNKDGHILVEVSKRPYMKKLFYIYNLKNRVMHEARIDGLDLENGCETELVLIPNSLCDIITNSNLIKRRAVCPDYSEKEESDNELG